MSTIVQIFEINNTTKSIKSLTIEDIKQWTIEFKSKVMKIKI